VSGVDVLFRTRILILSIAFSLPAVAGVGPIGMATSEGDIQVSQVRTPGFASLYEGAVVETGNTPARLSFRNGSVVHLNGRASIHQNLLLLEQGTGQLDTSGDYAVRARSVTVVPTSHPASARLVLSKDGRLQVAALTGTFEIRRTGTSSIAVGRSTHFWAGLTDAGASVPVEYKGCLAKSNTGYLLQDDATKSVIALRAESISARPGDSVNVTGKPDPAAPPVKGASQVVQVLRLTVSGHGCSSKAVLAAASGAAGGVAASAGAAGATTAAGISATTITIIGVAAASAAIIPTVALTSGSGASVSTISPSSR
jgi:hypothetical protein